MVSAMSSLPVPVSPVMSTLVSSLATRSTSSFTRRMGSESPMMLEAGLFSPSFFLNRRIWSWSRRFSSARLMTISISFRLKGLVK